MAEVQLSTVVDLDLVKMKWREQYVSEGLNKKIVPSQPPGIYQGLRIIENTGSPRQVELQPDQDTGFHMAVYQSTTGYSITYWDPNNTSIILDLSDGNLSGQETIIGLEIDYQIGVDTTANWMAFPLADWDALPAARKNEIVVLGTVQVPVLVGDNILQAAISYERTTYAWRGLSKGVLPWSPVLRNGDFEQGGAGTAFDQAWYWQMLSTPATGSGSVFISDSDPDRNAKHLRVTALTTGSFTFAAKQNVYVPVTPGQLVMVRGRKKQLLAPSSGTIDVTLTWSEYLGGTGSTTVVNIDAGTTDAGYEDFLYIFEVPVGVTGLLRDVSIGGTVTYGSSPAELIYIDDVQVYLETSGERNDFQMEHSGDQVVNGRLTVREPETTYATDGVVIDHDSAGPGLSIGLYDPDPTNFVVDVDGSVDAQDQVIAQNEVVAQKQVISGAGLLSTVAGANTSRLDLEPSVLAGVEYTLMWESVPSGSRGARIYVSPTGTLVKTVNAAWDNSADMWSKDVNGVEATRIDQGHLAPIQTYTQVSGTNTWADGAWVVPATPSFLVERQCDISAYAGIDGALWGFNGLSLNAGGEGLAMTLPLDIGATLEEIHVYYNSTWSAGTGSVIIRINGSIVLNTGSYTSDGVDRVLSVTGIGEVVNAGDLWYVSPVSLASGSGTFTVRQVTYVQDLGTATNLYPSASGFLDL